MAFELVPILEYMEDFYKSSPSTKRFDEYLYKLQKGNKDELDLPIMAYNPMAKEHVLHKIQELRSYDAEKIAMEELEKVNSDLNKNLNATIKVVINVADDIKGAWTQKAITDFSSKFQMGAFVKRNFCAPIFWVSETYSRNIIKARIREHALRTIYWKRKEKPLATLKELVAQESFISSQSTYIVSDLYKTRLELVDSFYKYNKDESDLSILFNFFYGDEASSLLGYRCYGIKSSEGFSYARILNNK